MSSPERPWTRAKSMRTELPSRLVGRSPDLIIRLMVETLTASISAATGIGASIGGRLAHIASTASGDASQILDKVRFAPDRDEVLPESSDLLGQVAKVLLENPWVTRVRVEGHTDDQRRLLLPVRDNGPPPG